MSARKNLLNYFLENVGIDIPREPLREIAKISDWARVVRKLREDGWDIETTRAGYILRSKTQKESLRSRKPVNKKLRYQILQRDNSICQRCGRTPADGVKLDVDHKIPVDWGGTDDPTNLWTLCEECNEGKRNFFSDMNNETMSEVLKLDSGAARIKRFFELNRGIVVEPTLLTIISQIRDWERTLRSIRQKENMNIAWIRPSKDHPGGGYIYEK